MGDTVKKDLSGEQVERFVRQALDYPALIDIKQGALGERYVNDVEEDMIDPPAPLDMDVVESYSYKVDVRIVLSPQETGSSYFVDIQDRSDFIGLMGTLENDLRKPLLNYL